jgi:N-acyl-D-amino-acid deacylase
MPRMVPALAGALLAGLVATQAWASTLIFNARLVDGTGAPARAAAVRIDGDRIVEVGDLQVGKGETVVDAHGLVLAPGFIDTHSHHDWGMEGKTDAPTVVSQGVTTIVVGQDGASELPLSGLWRTLAEKPLAVNLASYSGHNTLRARVMGEDYKRPARPDEVEAMKRLLEADMAEGALGLSSGLEYDPGIYSEKAEVLALAEVSAGHGGRYISHIRSEDQQLWAALDEIVDIGRRTGQPVQVSHMKLAMTDWWGQAAHFTGKLDAARKEGIRVTGDVYPYEYWQSSLTVMFPKRDFDNRASAEFAVTSLSTPEGMIISAYAPEPALVGKSLAEIARARGTDPAQTLMDLIRVSEAQKGEAGLIASSMRADDIAALIAWDGANICSDGEMAGRHPRGAGAFTKVLRHYVRETRLLTLEQAVRKMSATAAEHMGFADRGVIRPGAYADLVLFDPATVADRSTIAAPLALSVGIERVWVNGETVWEGGRTTTARPGKAIKRAAAAP